jgi:hypothetical protein
MVTARDQKIQNAQRIIRDVFNCGANSPLKKTLTANDLLDISDWMHLSVEDLKLLVYDNNGTEMHLNLGQWMKIRQFQMYVLHEHTHGSPASYNGGNITLNEFDLFCGSTECICLMMASQQSAATTTSPNVVVSMTQAELANFKKGCKRDAALYPVMTQDTQSDSWNHSIVSLARAQSVEQVLDDMFTPVLPDEVALFSEKNKFMYAVFERSLQSDKG